MSTSQPIRDTQDLTALREFYLKDEPNMRNYVLICLGVNSALRISDLLELKWKDVYNFKDENFKKHLIAYEKKTGKETLIAINENARNGLQEYMKFLKKISSEDYIFKGKYNGGHLSRSQAFRIIKHAAGELNLENGISCHSMRKTFWLLCDGNAERRRQFLWIYTIIHHMR